MLAVREEQLLSCLSAAPQTSWELRSVYAKRYGKRPRSITIGELVEALVEQGYAQRCRLGDPGVRAWSITRKGEEFADQLFEDYGGWLPLEATP